MLRMDLRIYGAIVLLTSSLIACGGAEEAHKPSPSPDLAAQQPARQRAAPRSAEAEGKNPYPTRYKVKDGHISYTYKGLQTGTEEVYFTNYGMVEIKFTKTYRENPFKSGREDIDIITLMRDSAIYVVSALESPTLDLNEVAEDVFRSKGGLIVGKDTIAGIITDKWDIQGANTKEWRWKGITLKTYVTLPRNFVQVQAVMVDTLSPLPEGIFDLPTDVNVQEGTSIKQWIEDLSKPVQRKKFFDLTDPKKAYDKQGNVIPIESLRVE